METQQTTNNQSFLTQMEHFFKTYLHDKAPFHLPPNVREFLVKFGPWVNLVIILLTLPIILLAFGLSTLIAPFAFMAAVGTGKFFALHIIMSAVSLVLEICALPGLFARKTQGWRLTYYASLVSALGQVLRGDIIGAVIGLAISLYVLFEIKDYYK